MADSRRHTKATAQNSGRDYSSPNQNTQFGIQFDDEALTQYAPNHAKRRVGTPDTLTFDEAEEEAHRGQHDQQYEGGQYGSQYGRPHPQHGSTNLHAHPAPNSSKSDPLRYPLARYIPPEGYYDCDQFYLVMHAGVGDNYTNCFGCGRPKTEKPDSNPTHCAGFPLCPKWIRCNFCSEPCGAHYEQYCPKLWATSSFLNRYSNFDVRTGFPDNLQVKPNAIEAEHLQQSGHLAISQYTNSIDQPRTLYRWLIPERKSKNPIRDFSAMSKSQRNRYHKEARRTLNPASNQTPRKQWVPRRAPQPQNSSNILMPGTKRKTGLNAEFPNGFAGVGSVRPSDDDTRKRMNAQAYGTKGTRQSGSQGGMRQAPRPQFAAYQDKGDALDPSLVRPQFANYQDKGDAADAGLIRPEFANYQDHGDAADAGLIRPQFANYQDRGDAAGLDLATNKPAFDGISIRGSANRAYTFRGSSDTSMSRGGGRGGDRGRGTDRSRGGDRGRGRGRGQGGY